MSKPGGERGHINLNTGKWVIDGVISPSGIGLMSAIALEVSICDQRRSYIARFATEEQALAFIERKSTTHAFYELDNQVIPKQYTRLIQRLYPTCSHGLSARNCYGPQHYYYDEEEQARGMRNGW